MARKTPIDRLAEDISAILEDYEGEVRDNLRDITNAMARKGAQALRRESKARFKGGSGKYAKGWKAEDTDKTHRQVAFSSVIYNERYGLPHLLEHGHATRNGTGRTYPDTPAHEHIAPIEQELVEAYEKEILSKL